MGDLTNAQGDDAPLATSKRHDAAADAMAQLPEGQGDTLVNAAVTINKDVATVYASFRDLANWPRFMENVVRIEVVDDSRSHWVVKAPGGTTVQWDARITEEQPERSIAWTSEDGADVANSGRVEFRDAGARGTVVTLTILYDPPGGLIGKVVAKMFQREPKIQARRDLTRFKQLMETGEIATPAMNPKQFEEMGL